jgi:hypothetical protein
MLTVAAVGGLAGLWWFRRDSAQATPVATVTVPASTPATAASPATRPPPAPVTVTASPVIVTVTPSVPAPPAEVLVTSAGSTPRQNPARVQVMTTSGGKPCVTGAFAGWGSYPGATCTVWQRTAGLLTGRILSKRSIVVACQADLGTWNPVYTANQTNTWWFWARSDDGTWDWFPETSISEGTSNQPVNGVALCVA